MPFSWNSELSVLQGSHTHFDEDSFRFHSYEEFQAKCDLKGDLYVSLGRITFLGISLNHSLRSLLKE
ncbi:hypothetical protein YC2023_095494 [Brassica napus]